MSRSAALVQPSHRNTIRPAHATATVNCSHQTGTVTPVASQSWVTIAGGKALVFGDLDGCSIAGCSNYGTNVKPCTSTLATTAGISSFIRIDGVPVLRDDATGYTEEELGECLHALGRPDEARPFFARAHERLSRDSWLVENEPDRIARLKRLGTE